MDYSNLARTLLKPLAEIFGYGSNQTSLGDTGLMPASPPIQETPVPEPPTEYMSQVNAAMDAFGTSPLAARARELTLGAKVEADYEGTKRAVYRLGELELSGSRVPIALKRWTSRQPGKEVALFEPHFFRAAAERHKTTVPQFTFAINIDGRYALITEDLTAGGRYKLRDLSEIDEFAHFTNETRYEGGFDLRSSVAHHLNGVSEAYFGAGLHHEVAYKLFLAATEDTPLPVIGSTSFAVIDEKRGAVTRLVCADVDQLLKIERFDPNNGYIEKVRQYPELLDELILNM